ncbi:hypothetical protein KEF85_07865 [Methylomonas paludis]|uniref:Porin n=1 Tax=Methylomonas paludis TaxID=1173101 RepID=A0A975RBJ4_9GAMM|nr:OprO/OprP family phosphate-selective porin [Methylomonas paludis]QWF72351.1 hypothetical protein KEF85_07865 [Methylomonas paludis]
MNTLKLPRHLRPATRKSFIRDYYATISKGLGYSLMLGYLLSPGVVLAKDDNSEIRKLRKQMEEYQQQIKVTNERLLEIEAKEALRAANTNQPDNSLTGNSGNGKTASNGVAIDTPTAKKRNVQEEPEIENPDTAKVPSGHRLGGFYDNGFVLRTNDNRYSLAINGLVQSRYTLNLPSKNAGSDNQGFDLALGRLFFSGTAFDPNLSYFFFYQSSTLNNTNRVDTIDWWGKYQLGNLGIKAGRILPQFSRQFYTDIGKYLFMDLQQPEYAFSLQRTPGLEFNWKSGKWNTSLTVGNSVRALDSVSQQNVGTKLAGIGRVVYDILDPYTYVQETITDSVETPQLSLGGAIGYNPVDANSGLQNTVMGMDTYTGTADIGYRYKLFNTEAAFFARQDHDPHSINSAKATSNNYGWYWQAGYYLVPKRLELAGTANQVLFEHQNGSPYKNQTIGSVGLNYYFYDHHFKLQTDYSHISGDDWAGQSLIDNRVRLQGQVYF